MALFYSTAERKIFVISFSLILRQFSLLLVELLTLTKLLASVHCQKNVTFTGFITVKLGYNEQLGTGHFCLL
jgi:hypothetical protein